MQAALPRSPRDWPGVRSLRSLSPGDRRTLIVLAVVVFVSLVLRIATWDPIADGARARYVKTALLGAAAAAAVWGLIRLQTPASSRVPLLCALGVLFAGDAVHYARLLNPITRGAPVVAVNSSFTDELAARTRWALETSNGGKIVVEGGALRLESPPGGNAYAIARLAAPPNPLERWWLPVGLLDRERDERIAWRASVQRTGTFYVVAELRRLLIQVVSYGVHVSYPDQNNTLRGNEIQHPVGTDGQVHEWVVARNGREIALEIDGKPAWKAPDREPVNQVRLGESKSDSAHAGTMRLERASYAATLNRG